MIHHSKGVGKGFPGMYVLLIVSYLIKRYGHLSMIFLFFNDLLPNMVMSRDIFCLFWKFVIIIRFSINPIRPGLFSRSPGPGGGLRGPDAKNRG